MKYGTVTVVLTEPGENLTDLANAYAQMGFVAKITEGELIEQIKNIIQDQYFQSIFNT